MTYVEFSRQFFAVLNAIQDSLEKVPVTSEAGVPADWRETQARLKLISEDLMLCADVERAVAVLRKDSTMLLIAQHIVTEIEESRFLEIMQRAYAATPHASAFLPGQAFAGFLIEVANCSEPYGREN